MKKLSRVLALLLTLCMVLALLPTVFAAPAKEADFAFLVTSDLHGQIYATDYTADAFASGTYKRGLTRISTYVNEMRDAYGEENIYLADIGDTIQGAPLTYYYAFNQPTADDPAVKALRTMDYDMWVIGNHEFNYGKTILQRQLNYATSADTATESAVKVCMANYLKTETNNAETKDWATWNDYAPYEIKQFGEVKVAVIGFGNPNVPKWDVPANWEGIYFADIVETYKHYEAEMLEAADMIVVMAHSGINSDDGADFMERLVQQTDTIDFVFSGHEHGNKVNNIKNLDGKDIPVLQPYTKARAIAQVLVSGNATDGFTVVPSIVNMENYALDLDLVSVLQPYETAVWNNYMSIKIGEASADFSASDLGTAPSAFMDLINAVQLWGGYDNGGVNTPDDATDDTPAQLSISAPLTSGDNANIIDQGDIMLGDMFKLYRYENWFYQITMSGEEVHQWLEFAATKIQVNAEGKPTVSSGDLTYYDVIYGDGFYYEIDYTKPVGERIVAMTYNNEAVAADDEFTVVVNNYRYNGGGNYVKWLNAHGCEFVANDPDRIIYSTQFDMIQGEDLGQARSLLMDYIRAEETIDPTITSTWKLTEPTDEIIIYYTNDVHTYIDGALSYDSIAALKTETAKWASGVLLVDAGDHAQGTAFGSMDKGAKIIEMMNAAGYDAATLGNHEFDYGMERALEIVEDAEFDYLSANFYHEADGVKGDSVLDAYKLYEVGGKKIAFVGITTPESFTKSTPKYFQDAEGNYIYGIAGGDDGAELYASVQTAIDAAKAAGAEYVIALGHLGVDSSSAPWTSKEVIANVSGLDAFIDGHSHSTVVGELVMDKDGEDVLLTQTGSYFDAIGRMSITDEGITTSLVTETLTADATVKGIKDAWIESVNTQLGEVIGHADVTFNNYDAEGNRLVRKQETNTGDFAADALYYLFDVTEGLDVDCAIMNGGGVRNKAVTGDLSYLSCKSIHTFGNVACLQTVTGQQLLDALEWGARDVGTAECGGFLQVSGITYEIHSYITSTVQKDDKGVWAGGPTGEYRVRNVTVGGETLDLNANYNLAGYNYTLRDLGDGFAMFDGAVNVKDYVMEDYMVLANYVKSFPVDETTNLPTITDENSPYGELNGEGRIQVVTAPSDSVVILYTNDVHTYIGGALSYDSIAALKQQLAVETKGVLLVDAGDHVQGTAYGSMDEGAKIIEMMNAAGYDAATLGNHEFDYGMARALEIVEEAEFDYLSANFYEEAAGVKGDNVLDAYKLYEVGGKKIALVGITTPESFTKSTPKYFQDAEGNYIYGIAGGDDGAELYACVQTAVDAAKAAGAEYVIALGHLGVDTSSSPWTSKELIANVSGLDAFIDGHSHSEIAEEIVKDKDDKDVILTQTGSYFDAIGKMTISADGIKTELITAVAGKDETVRAIKERWIQDTNAALDIVIGHADVTFDNYADGVRLVRKQETNTGDFAADALYYLFDVTEGLDVDCAIMNGGGVRNKAVTGDLSYFTCKTIHTFGNVACLQTVTGQQILDALEWGARDVGTAECGGFLQVSGITYEIHSYIASTVQKDDKGVWTGGPTGEYRVKNVKIGGEPINLTASYNLAGYNYTLRDLGDGFAMFDGAINVKDYVLQDYMVLANYVKSFPVDETTKLPTITDENSSYGDVNGEGRIKIIRFKDVAETAWYYKYVTEMADKGIIKGMTEDTFAPDAELTRGQLATLLYRAAGEPKVEGKSTFEDVADGKYYSVAITWAQQNEIVNGVTEKTFAPDGKVTREQFVTMLFRMAKATEGKGDLTKYADNAKISNYAVPAMKWAVESGLIDGFEDNTIRPQGIATRAQAAKLISAFLAIPVK